MGVRPFKFEIRAWFLDEEDGMVRDELVSQPVVLYGDNLTGVGQVFDTMLAERLKKEEQ